MTAPYGFKYTETALKFLETMVPVKIRGQIKRRIESLASDPTPPGSKKYKASPMVKIQCIAFGKETIESLIRSGTIR